MQKRPGFLIVIILLFVCGVSFGQHEVKGRVFDAETGEGLPFVTVHGPDKTGAVADIDGRFRLPVKVVPVQLTFSVIGYEAKTLEAAADKETIVRLRPSASGLREVVILPSENPAWRIIRLASANRDRNNPEKNHSFSYNSYNKMFLTMEPELRSTKTGETVKLQDTSEMKRFLDNQYLFFSESYATRNYRSKLQDKETITATKIAGFKNPGFGMLASQFQSFSFYTELITINSKNYLNPLTANSENHYRFELIDTAYAARDTVFLITFEPKPGKNFDALKGTLFINSNGYAVQQVVAEPVVRVNGLFHARIQQQYRQVGSVWFPEQLNTFLSYTQKNSGTSADIVGEIRSYISEIKVDPGLQRKDVAGADNDIADGAGLKDSLYWASVRQVELNAKEKNTYRVIDSVGEAVGMDKKFRIAEYLIDGQIPVGPVGIQFSDLLRFNGVEKVRVGLGLSTNNRLSKWFSIGGAFGYGIRDERFKYRGDLKFYLVKDGGLTLAFQYLDDLDEPGSVNFERSQVGIAASENLRRLIVNRMDEITNYQVGLKGRLGKFITFEPFVLSQQRRISGYDYQFISAAGEGVSVSRDNFNTVQAGMNFRLAVGEKSTKVFNRVMAQPSKYPVLQARVVNNGQLDPSDYPFTSLSVQLDHHFPVKLLGQLTYRINASYVDHVAPYPFLFNGKSNLYETGGALLGLNRSINSFGSFETMRLNEFFSDRYVSVTAYYDLKSLLFRTEKFAPGVMLVGSALVGDLRSPQSHGGMLYTVPKKGFYETGLMFTNLLKLNFTALGMGVFYRVGPYRLMKDSENLAVKLNAVFNLE
ncbi:MAG: DUF5686 family protein [Bacteroidota bacterium]